MRAILVVGHKPPPVTGENLCRARMVEALESLGFLVENLSRSDFKVWVTSCDFVVIVNGQSALGMLYDVIVTCFYSLQRKVVYWYFHNRSWRYLRLLPAGFWRMISGDVVPIVLTDAIQETLRRSGYPAVVLNNRIEADFEARLVASGQQVANKRRLVWVGRADYSKGFWRAIDIFGMLRSEDPSWVFDVYGVDGAWAKKNDAVFDGICYHGFVSGVDKVKALSEGGVLILPSSYKNETQPLVIIEALSQGVPVVASDVGGIASMLRAADGAAGVVLRNADDAAYCRAVQQVALRYEEYSTRARRVYDEQFSADRFRAGVAQLFERRMDFVTNLVI